MSSYTHLPAIGATGNVNMGFKPSQGGLIGQWVAVPEPGETAGVIGLGLGAFALVRRNRK